MTRQNDKQYSFPQKVWIAGGILALIVVVLLLLRSTFSVLLLILAGSLIAVYFRGLSDLVRRKTKWKEGWCLAISIIGSLLLIILLFWLIGAKVQSQIAELSDTLPKTIDKTKEQLSQSSLGQKIVEKISSVKTQQRAQFIAQTFFKNTFGLLGDIYVVLFIGIFFTASPKLYKEGIVTIVPTQGKQKAVAVLNNIGTSLKKWLKGKLFAMLVVFVLTSIGLVIMGMPMWLTLALIAGLLNFIPNFGPLIALIPAVLVAFLQGPSTAAWVAALYIAVQVAESNFITPMVQQKLINIPPALIIIAQLLMAPLTGGWGLVLATPLMIILIVLVKELYIKKQESSS
ncbi:MAG TPA: AI-2E family transporter [Flavisolibacter sp.]|jgi:predicted PurR-regulated permease PerM|nr:AI-2E family transporter [Flavisolibacter sp.]